MISMIISMKYIGTKIINAQPMLLWEYHKLRGSELPADADPDEAGYLVEYTDGGKPNHPAYKGYISWSPKDVFDKAYRPLTELDFSMALVALKAGHKVARSNWERDLYMMLCKLDDGEVMRKFNSGGSIVVTMQGRVTQLSHEELFATDWMVVE